ncbi:Subtilisin-like protease family protein [Rhynchospora pubera]|uniref:Subtilisin-like protease family protein n=1 Tax=Rhynchospora pubera TaxID=906938 RepID=A0AAV8CI74_9POAL|nr:Subtilisin-like protease family protein [Rhynchospora pubera]
MRGGKLIFVGCILISLFAQISAVKKSYIVYLGSHSHGPDATLEDYELVESSHYKLLGSYVGSEEKARDAIIYSYTKNINGFAATMEENEAEEIAKHPDVLSVFENTIHKLQTSRSWSFVDMDNAERDRIGALWTKAKFGRDIIIATLDSGVWPESKSFSDEGMAQVPSKWRGYCENNTKDGVPCNRKLIGARYFNKGIRAFNPDLNITNSARDTDGHGTHTLSTAGGNFVPGASYFGYANGTIKGGAPGARVAAYKTCWAEFCMDADLLAGFEAAIHDKVDVLSLSIGSAPVTRGLDYLDDALAIGSLHAVAKGITVVCAAGNNGPDGTIVNVAPWFLSVGASTIDREYLSSLRLGHVTVIKGATQESETLPQNRLYPLINSSDAAAHGVAQGDAALCDDSSLDPEKVKGKIVVCMGGVVDADTKTSNVREAGGVGVVIVNQTEEADYLTVGPNFLPSTMISYKHGLTLLSYMESTNKPLGNISPPESRIGVIRAPVVADFSSRGPSNSTPEILKPDVIAPGVNILAAFSPDGSSTDIMGDTRSTPYALLSGTSMACPHVSGVAALLKMIHRDWSPAAIKSAIMTTARTRDNKKQTIRDYTHEEATPFLYGNGHIRPNRAADPGLVYDITTDDYLNFLCALGFNATYLSNLTETPYFTCPSEPMRLENLNYPAISVPALDKTFTVTRTLKNVGSPGTYKVHVVAPSGVDVVVTPAELSFSRVGEEKSFRVAMTSKHRRIGKGYTFGRMVWSDGKHYVRSAVAVNVVA